MIFKETTKWQLKKIIGDLNYEASEYEWGSEEYEFLDEIAAEIEDAIWGVEKWAEKEKWEQTGKLSREY